MSKKFSILITISLLVFSSLVSGKVIAWMRDNVSGLAWSENIGWISFNSLNCDPNGNGASNGGLGCPFSGTSIANYGVKLDLSTNKVYGWARAYRAKGFQGQILSALSSFPQVAPGLAITFPLPFWGEIKPI
jgi:hypothetical protein